MKELVNGQVFESLVASRTLKKLRIIRCLGNWDKVLQVNGDGDSSLTEIHLERLQVSDFGLSAISKCRKLETLHIVKTPECSNSGLVCVVERCRLLRKLHIDGWRTKRIGDEGLMALAKHCLVDGGIVRGTFECSAVAWWTTGVAHTSRDPFEG
ncbi:hypothetical protein Bca52824_028289 [Brassica carinata]|uniref:F-box family protein n=1 Tax=Brassica carinata TaxID=52824 RepID=A0A8X7VC70_BRACI|nr:hypothetical protein Bca52824_028289 [Brassica carinata]